MKWGYTSARLRYVWGIFGVLAGYMVLLKAIFLLRYGAQSASAGWWESLGAIWHGLRLDLVVAAYLAVLPLLLVLAGSITPLRRAMRTALYPYYAVVALLLSLIYTVDLELFGYWDFRIDASVLLYAAKPREALASVEGGAIAVLVAVMLVLAVGLTQSLWWFHRRYFPKGAERFSWTIAPAAVLSLGGLFLCMRSSVGTSTANIGMVYHSTNQYINQASVNPAFSLLVTLRYQDDLTKGMRFYPPEARDSLYSALNAPRITGGGAQDSIASLRLRVARPNVVLILLESFSANAMGFLGHDLGVSPSMDSLAASSWCFARTYASSFRTDRGLAATLSGYPAQPNSSILKYPKKSRTLPSLAHSLGQAGYSTHMLYGGDVDFTNMRSYFLATGYERLTDIRDFPARWGLSKWGVRDEHTFAYLREECLRLSREDQPFFYTFLTLSSHEPFDVPSRVHAHPYLNSVAYTDSCVGVFMRGARRDAHLWDNTLFVFMSDHGYPYPESATPDALSRYHIAHIWTGGAIDRPRQVNRVVSQTDLPATLLAALGIEGDFPFSKSILDGASPEYAFFTFPDLVGLVDSAGATIRNFRQGRAVYHDGGDSARRMAHAQAMLQVVLEDMQGR